MYGDRKGSKVMKINFVSSLHRSMSSWHLLTILLLLLSLQLRLALGSFTLFGPAKKAELRDQVRQMFYHAYDNYMQYAFPHDELKPLTKTFTDSLGELGNLKLERLSEQYNGSALTLVESLSSLHVLGNSSEFEKGVLWLGENLTFDVDVRVSLFECNIRLLGGLISAHLLATDLSKKSFREPYKDQLLILANDLGQRFLRAFDTPTGLPYAWINLKHGVMENETTETSTSGCGSLILEMGALSRLTGKPEYEESALRALRKLWSMRSSLDLMGTTLDVTTGEWIEHSSGIGAGVDSFYEYLIKAHILFGRDEYWDMFSSAYTAVQKYFRHGPWYHEADMRTGKATHWQLTSLQAFWPGLQILVGDVLAANSTHREFFSVWERYGVLPERYLLDRDMLHPTEKYYPLRPELAESTLFLYQATRDPWYLEVGEAIINSLNVYTRVNGGFASVRDVTTMKLEDHQHSFFLAETCKYLYLLFDDTFLVNGNYVFSTEGHPLPVTHSWHEWIPSIYMESEAFEYKRGGKHVFKSAMSSKLCPVVKVSPVQGKFWVESACHVLDKRSNHKCQSDKECGVDATTCREKRL
ncbi:alpha-mannosidase I MNS5 isoform X2 [Cryptomeria japonica]|uniref:alpha-mannosidase I MNS5 isoform X2 n=1 Tax=Cryptomeria japonica TaxID=3369 RepID=UPI0025AD3607|nr:alpha-mannosidase I MNS5 isoform X2 [Cryptomeria japonica]